MTHLCVEFQWRAVGEVHLEDGKVRFPALLESAGAVSREVGEAMAEGVRNRLRTGLGVAVTGIAGPGAEGTSKPVGLTYVAVASDGHVASREFNFSGDRAAIRRQAAIEALRLLIDEARRLRQARKVKSA